jgi:hypothetical protein
MQREDKELLYAVFSQAFAGLGPPLTIAYFSGDLINGDSNVCTG